MRCSRRSSLVALAFVVVMPGACQAPDSHPASAPSARPPRDILSTAKPRYSHANEEIVIRDFFQDRRDGVFLDVGCGHPIDDSNTYYLEKHLHWSGMGVDALPEMAPKWRRNRPASKFLNYIATDHAGTMEPFYRAELKDISSIQKPTRDPAGGSVRSEQIQIPTATLTRLLELNGVSRIDFLSMDIEGAEPLALAGFDIERFKPGLACIEAKPVNRTKILKYFTDHGYRQIDRYLDYDKTNYYFTPRDTGR